MEERQYISIKSWLADDRPREKMQREGPAVLSAQELLTVLLRSGRVGESAMDLARRILGDCDNDLGRLARLSVDDLSSRYKGVGRAKASAIVAALELGRRRSATTAEKNPQIRSSSDSYCYFQPILCDLDHEEFWGAFLNRSGRVMKAERLFKGGLDSTLVDVRVLFRRALELKARSLVIAHNHPSGEVNPSTDDKDITAKIRSAGGIMDIPLLDHIIIGTGHYFSFADENILPVIRRAAEK